jgi:diguanylate cyclase (GGDEF)-like protein
MLDLDHFKSINDRHGHPVGDAVLEEVGRRFRTLTRAGEHMARMGGEEFAWILPGATGAQAYAAAERARRAIESEPFDGVGTLTVSVGVCELADAGCPDELHRLADVALYWAKAQGRNLVFRWTADTAQELDAAGAIVPSPRRTARLEALRAVARAVDEDRPAGPGHADRVADLAARAAASLGWPAARVAALREAAELHDVGKVALPPALLRKPTAFDDGEWAQVRAHPGLGADMLDGVLDEEQRSWVRGHHERWDGGGYPDALAGEAIPMGARLLSAADAYDAMTSARAYSPARSPIDAIFEVRTAAGRQFDPQVADALIAVLTSEPTPA